MSDAHSQHDFQTTCWTAVFAAQGGSPESRQALRDLCAVYYLPVERFVAHYRGVQDSRDLAHEFFAKLLEGQQAFQADRRRGRFRSYLLGAVKHFLADVSDRDRAEKRGGGKILLSLNQSTLTDGDDSEASSVESATGTDPVACFDREWAVAVVETALAQLRQQAIANGHAERFEALKPWLMTPTGHDTAMGVAQQLQLSEGAFKVAVHRLRKQFRQTLRAMIAQTVESPGEIEQELQYLATCLTTHAG